MHGLGADVDLPEAARVVAMPIQRRITFVADLVVLVRLILFFRREQFDIVHSLLPKSGLLAMLAAWAVRVPQRVHTFTGQVWATEHGVKRRLLRAMDRLLAACASQLLADSNSQCEFLVLERVVARNKIHVLAHGSICGVDLVRFARQEATRSAVRAQLAVDPKQVMVLFVGRMNREKGVGELIAAYLDLRRAGLDVRLLLVGPDEDGLVGAYGEVEGMQHIGYTPHVERFFSAADVLCLPSHREGFGSVLIEAGAAGLAVVASRIYGITDAVEHGVTGLLHEAGDVADLRGALGRLVISPTLRRQLGVNGRSRAENLFAKQIVTDALVEFYGRLTNRPIV
jgi:glycosyltransferase involved in cell wall biosynthesis